MSGKNPNGRNNLKLIENLMKTVLLSAEHFLLFLILFSELVFFMSFFHPIRREAV